MSKHGFDNPDIPTMEYEGGRMINGIMELDGGFEVIVGGRSLGVFPTNEEACKVLRANTSKGRTA